jgi:ABC-2 type transport system ATP-binding protein
MNVNPVIHFDNVSLSFGTQVALRNVSYEIQPGVVFALLGENGAGKTTSIKTMLGMCTPDQGQVRVLGMHPMARSFDIRGQVGYVPEQASLYDWMTIKEAGWFAAGFYPSGYQAEFEQLTKSFGLSPGQKISKLSKGMRAKVVLSLAMAHKPPLLILDEPTSGLDTLVRREFPESMVDMTAAGQTVFLSSHQIPEVERVADTVAIMKEGKLLLVEELSQLKDTCREVIVTYEDHVNLTAIPGNVVHHAVQGRQCVCLIRTDNEEQFYRLQDRPEVRTVDVRRPSLEDIFVAYMRADRLASNGLTSLQQSETVR